MSDHVRPFLTPISEVLDTNNGEHLTTGAYIEICAKRYLMTNEHVARVMKQHPITHQLCGSNDVIRSVNPMVACPAPIDVALAAIDDGIWAHCAHNAAPIPLSRFAVTHRPVPGELLFTVGYGGSHSKFLFDTLVSPASPYLTREAQMLATHGDPAYHFALPYAPDRALSPEAHPRGLPTPPGMSGSLVWNTHFVELIRARARADWSPSMAQVTGLVWGWPDVYLIATKVEHLPLKHLAIEASAQQRKRSQDQPALKPPSTSSGTPSLSSPPGT